MGNTFSGILTLLFQELAYALGGYSRVRTSLRFRSFRPSRSSRFPGLLGFPHQPQDRLQVAPALPLLSHRRLQRPLQKTPPLSSSHCSFFGARHPPASRPLRLGSSQNSRHPCTAPRFPPASFRPHFRFRPLTQP